jgi:hypothetical protein
MPDAPQRRRFISPAMLLAVLLCFFLPFFSVSCTAGVGQMQATVTGMDQVFGGEPEYSGFRPPAAAGAAADEESSQVSPLALTGFATIVVGIGLGLGLPRPRVRWVSGAVASGIALVAVVVNQVMVHARAQEALDGAESSFRDQLGSSSIFGQAIPMPALELHDEPGFWIVTVLLGLVLAYNVYELAVHHPRTTATVPGSPIPPPYPQAAPPGYPPGHPQLPPPGYPPPRS